MFVDGGLFALLGDNERADAWANTSSSCLLFCRFGLCNRHVNLYHSASPRDWATTKLEVTHMGILKKSGDLKEIKKRTTETGVSSSGFVVEEDALDPHTSTSSSILLLLLFVVIVFAIPFLLFFLISDVAVELLHTSRQGIVAFALKSTLKILKDHKPLINFLKSFDFSGLSGRFSSDLKRLSSFTGKEYGLLAQVMPFALISLKASGLLITAWCLISELVVDDYSWSPRREDLSHKEQMVSLLSQQQEDPKQQPTTTKKQLQKILASSNDQAGSLSVLRPGKQTEVSP